MHLVATEIWGRYRVDKPFRLPFHSGSMLRGVLGRALHAAACARRAEACGLDCEVPTACTYARLFDPPVPEPLPHRFLRGQTRAPQPMIPLFPAPRKVDLGEGAEISLGLRVLGPLRAGEMETIFATLEGMSHFDFGDEGGRLAFEGVMLRGRKETPLVVEAQWSGIEGVEVIFETPVWLEHQGRLLERVNFQAFFRAIYRRLTVLCALYGQADDNDDAQFGQLDDMAGRIVVVNQDMRALQWRRHSIAREREHPMLGLLGRVVFAGEGWERLLPILRLAEKTHIGKATSHGLGRMRVEV